MNMDKSPLSKDSATTALDRKQLAAFAGGDLSAIEPFIRAHEQRLARTAYRIVGCQSEAEDVRNAVFTRLLTAVRSSDPIDNPAAWLTRCVVNEALTRVRRRGRENRLLSGWLHLRTTVTNSTSLQRAVDDETKSELQHALQTLTPAQRALVSLRFDEGFTFEEIAQLLSKPTSTIKSQLSRTISLLRTALANTNR